LLALSGALLVAALAGPRFSAPPERLVVVIDRSASMAAGRRWEEAFGKAKNALEGVREAAVVLAGNRPEVLGPGSPQAVLEELGKQKPGDRESDAQAALKAAARALPGAPAVWIGDQDPGTAEAYLPVGSEEENAGIVRLGASFLVLGHQGPAPREIEFEVDGRHQKLRLPARGFRVLKLEAAERHRARIVGEDALALDDPSFYLRARPRVELGFDHPAVARLVGLLGLRPTSSGELRIVRAVPERPSRPTLFFAPKAQGLAVVADREAGHPLLRGAELLGETLPVPPPPPEPFHPLAVDEEGRGLVYSDGQSLYLPPVEALADKPYFPVLVYNFFAPYLRAARGLGEGGVRSPKIQGGVAYILENPEETLLPSGDPPRPLAKKPRDLGYALLLLVAAIWLLESRVNSGHAGPPPDPRRRRRAPSTRSSRPETPPA